MMVEAAKAVAGAADIRHQLRGSVLANIGRRL